MKRWFIFLVVLAVLAAGGYFFYTRWSTQRASAALTNLKTTPAERGELIATIGATGQVRANQTTLLGWKANGTVQDVQVKVGDTVKARQKLAELSQTSLPQAIILAQADLVAAQKALEDLYTNSENAAVQALQSISTAAEAVKSAQYQIDNYIMPAELQGMGAEEAFDAMQKRLDTARTAFEPYKFYPESDSKREELKDNLDQAQADLNAAVKRLEYEYTLNVAKANLVRARQDYEKYKNGPTIDDVGAAKARIAAAQATLSQAWIEAPFDGTVTLVDTHAGDQAAVGTQAFRLDDLSSLLVDLSVSEVDINQVKPGQDVTMTFDAIRNNEYKGKVIEVDRVGSQQQGAVEFVVTVRLEDPDEQVRPGMTAAVNVVVSQLGDVLLVPNRAVRFVEGKQVVYILKDGQLTPVNIKLGASSDTSSEVLEGDLAAGDAIVLNPPLVFDNNGPPPFVQQR
jgi:HlyD family secretion protein